MRRLTIVFFFLGTACSSDKPSLTSRPDVDKSPISQEQDAKKNPIDQEQDAEKPSIDQGQGAQGKPDGEDPLDEGNASEPADETSDRGEQGTDEGEGPSEEEGASDGFPVDAETLTFPVVFHLGDSGDWASEESLKAVLAETQRILAQAKIEFIPQFTQNPDSTDFLDVTYVPSVPNNPGVNGISFGGADLEVFVKDRVGLGKVDDKRPASAPLGRTFAGAKPGDSIEVGNQEARQARTTAHEIAHQLGLPHRQDSTNLMASGTTGWTLNNAEIDTMRKNAVRKFKAKFVEVLD